MSEKILEYSELHFSRNSMAANFFALGKNYPRKDFLSHRKYGAEPYDYLFALDLATRCSNATNCFCFEAMSEGASGNEKASAQILSAASVSSYICQLMVSAQGLIWRSEDLSARILARSISEACDYSIALQFDEQLAETYVSSSRNFRQVWYEHFRSEKIQKARNRALKLMFGEDTSIVTQVHEYKKSEGEIFSEAVHPSYYSGFAYLFSGDLSGYDGPEWEFAKRWPHSRVVASIVDSTNLQISTLLLNSLSERDGWLRVPIVEKSFFKFDRAAIESLLNFTMLATSFISQSHLLYPEEECGSDY